jgi:ABC-type multidrug transport system fused ATPase/permease subunit
MTIFKTPLPATLGSQSLLSWLTLGLTLLLSAWPMLPIQAQNTLSFNGPTLKPAPAPQARGFKADLAGVNLWFTDTAGTAGQDVLILLHPNTGSSEIWALQSAVFAKAGYRVIAFDRRGWSQSFAKTPMDNGASSIAQDLEALVEHLKIDRFHLLGIAGGGFAAIDYAAWKPERIKSLIVGGSTAQLSEPTMKEVVDRIEIPAEDKVMKFDFPTPPRSGNDVVKIENLAKEYKLEDGKTKPVFKGANGVIRRLDKIAVVGVNGAGKSTLLKIITGQTEASSGECTIGAGVKIGYFSQHALEVLNSNKTLFDEIHDRIPDATIGLVRNLLGAFLFSGDDVEKKINVLYAERVKKVEELEAVQKAKETKPF